MQNLSSLHLWNLSLLFLALEAIKLKSESAFLPSLSRAILAWKQTRRNHSHSNKKRRSSSTPFLTTTSNRQSGLGLLNCLLASIWWTILIWWGWSANTTTTILTALADQGVKAHTANQYTWRAIIRHFLLWSLHHLFGMDVWMDGWLHTCMRLVR